MPTIRPRIDSAWFMARLADRRLSQRRLATLLHKHPSAVTMLFKGRRRMQLNDASIIAQALGTTLEQVIEAAGIDMPPGGGALMLVSGTIEAPSSKVVSKPPTPARRVHRPVNCSDDVLALCVQAPASPLHRWILYYASTQQFDPAAVGRLMVGHVPAIGA